MAVAEDGVNARERAAMSGGPAPAIPGPAGSQEPAGAIVARAICKRFGQTMALDNVGIVGQAGSVHAITGENGAGKSTLMKILAGVEQPDSGQVLLRGKPVRFSGPRDALVRGVSTIFQEFTLLPNLSVAENLYLGREPLRHGWLARRAMLRDARAVLERVGVAVQPEWLASRLTVGEQQLVEIAKGVSADASVFIFDEPTAALNKAEVDKLRALIGELKAQGKAIFYISHRLEEIFQFCDTVTVLKDGRHVTTAPAASLDGDQLVTLMVGRPIQDLFPIRAVPAATAAPVALDVRRLVPRPGDPAVQLQLRRGEILGLAGLEGQGQREILRSLVGVNRPHESDIRKTMRDGTVHAIDRRHGVVACVRRGIGFVPEDRKTEGLYLDLSIYANVSLGRLKGLSLAAPVPRTAKLVDDIMQRMQLRAQGAGQPVAALSGGNQQKVMLGRWLAAGIDTLLIEQPTRGVDVGAKAEIYRLLREFADDGGAVMIVSSELTEIVGLCDRVLVVRGGRLVAEVAGAQASEETLLDFALKDPPQTAREATVDGVH